MLLHTALASPPQDSVPQSLPLTVGWAGLGDWTTESSPGQGRVLLSPRQRVPAEWTELVACWNVQPADNAALQLEAQASFEDHDSAWYVLGIWAGSRNGPWRRTSLRDPGDADGRVKTDTLAVSHPARAFRLRVTLFGTLAGHPEHLRLITASVADTRVRPIPRPPNRAVWGRSWEVPERSQVSYAEGEAWCSPTCVSMLLGWWSRSLQRPELDRAVPEVAEGVHDPGWAGTGNWPFNMAYVGALEGMTATAIRLPDLRAVEDLIEAGMPVALSVNAPALRGEYGRENGHLILAVGFTEAGDLLANDPYARLDQGQTVRRTYRRQRVERAWENSHRLAYLVAPETLRKAIPILWQSAARADQAPPTGAAGLAPPTNSPAR